MWEKRSYTCMCNWVTMKYSRKLTEHCKPAVIKNKNHYIKEKNNKFINKQKRKEWELFSLITNTKPHIHKAERTPNKKNTKILHQGILQSNFKNQRQRKCWKKPEGKTLYHYRKKDKNYNTLLITNHLGSNMWYKIFKVLKRKKTHHLRSLYTVK